MAEEQTQETGRGVANLAQPKAGERKGLAEYGYSRQGYLDRSYLDSLVSPINIPTTPTTPTTTPSEKPTTPPVTPSTGYVDDKLAEYARQRDEARVQRVEDMVGEYLSGDNESASLYKDLYDSYYMLSGKDEEPLTRTQYVAKLTGMTSKLPKSKADKAFEQLMAEWKEDPAAFRKAQQASGITYGGTALDAYLTSSQLGQVMGWDEDAYKRGANLSGLEGWAESARTMAKQRESLDEQVRRIMDQREAERRNLERRMKLAEHGNSRGGSSGGRGGSSGGGGGVGAGGGTAV